MASFPWEKLSSPRDPGSPKLRMVSWNLNTFALCFVDKKHPLLIIWPSVYLGIGSSTPTGSNDETKHQKMVFFTKFSSSDLRVRAGSQHGSHQPIEALTFLAARVAGDGGDARKALQVGGPPKDESMGGRTHSRVFWGIGWELGTVVFVYDMLCILYMCNMCIIYMHTLYIHIYMSRLFIADTYIFFHPNIPNSPSCTHGKWGVEDVCFKSSSGYLAWQGVVSN